MFIRLILFLSYILVLLLLMVKNWQSEAANKKTKLAFTIFFLIFGGLLGYLIFVTLFLGVNF